MADAPDDDSTDVANEKLKAQQFKAECRKLSKQLKAKDAATKLAAIARCGEDAAFLEAECLVPLLQLCVAKKKNAEIVQAALSTIRSFVEETARDGVSDDDGTPTSPTCARARLLLDAADKKKNKIPGGKLFTDLLTHELPVVAADAIVIYRALVQCAALDDAPKKFGALVKAGDPVGALAGLCALKAPTDGAWPTEDSESMDVTTEAILAPAVASLAFLLEDEAASKVLVKAGGAAALARCAAAKNAPEAVGGPSLKLLATAASRDDAGAPSALLKADGAAAAIVALTAELAVPGEDEAPPPERLATCLDVLEKLLEETASATPEAPPPPDAAAPAPAPLVADEKPAEDAAAAFGAATVADALGAALKRCLAAEDAPAHGCLRAVARCLGRSVDAFGKRAWTPLTDGPALDDLFKALERTAPGSASRRCVDKALHAILAFEPVRFQPGVRKTPSLGARLRTTLAALADDARLRTMLAALDDACLGRFLRRSIMGVARVANGGDAG